MTQVELVKVPRNAWLDNKKEQGGQVIGAAFALADYLKPKVKVVAQVDDNPF